MDKFMEKQEAMEPLHKVEQMKASHAQLEIIKLQKEIEMLKLYRNYLCHLGHTMRAYSLPSPIYSTYLKS